MTRLCRAALLLLSAACATSDLQPLPDRTPANESIAGRFFPYAMKVHTLPNGLRLVTVPFDSPGLVAYTTLVRVGSRNEIEPGHSGFAHFFEHMMFRGTDRFTPAQYEANLHRYGADSNAFTTDDFTFYHIYFKKEGLPAIVEMEADRFQNLKYSQEGFQTEARAVLGEYNKSASQPLFKGEEVLDATAYDTSTYKHTTMGFIEDIRAMPSRYDYSLGFFNRWYTPSNCTIFVVGDFDEAAVTALVEKNYSAWSKKSDAVEIPTEKPQTQSKTAKIAWPTPTLPYVIYGWHTPAAKRDTLDAAIQNLLGSLAFGPASPLYKDLVLDRQLVESIDINYFDHRDPNQYWLDVKLKKAENSAAVESALHAALAKIASGDIDQKYLDTIKSNQRYSLLMGLETADKIAETLGTAAGPTGAPDALDHLMVQMAGVSREQIAQFVKQYFVETNRTIVTIAHDGEIR